MVTSDNVRGKEFLLAGLGQHDGLEVSEGIIVRNEAVEETTVAFWNAKLRQLRLKGNSLAPISPRIFISSTRCHGYRFSH